MMHLMNFALVLAVLINLAALTAVSGRFFNDWGIARAAGVIAITLGLFFIEHFVGLGQFSWLWPITTALSLYILWRYRQSLLNRGFHWAELVFVLAFAYGMLWRYAFPSIWPSSERVTNLYWINNYMSGSQLPPLDLWHPPYQFDFYYAYMHYAAALLGRLFGVNGGVAYNLSFCILQGMTIALGWSFVSLLINKALWVRIFMVVILTFGGTGLSPLSTLLYEPFANESPQSVAYKEMTVTTRFMGNFEHHINTDLGLRLFPRLTEEQKPFAGFEPRELPLEHFSYQFFVGDYHPPKAGFFLLLLLLACIAWLERYPDRNRDPWVHGLMAMTVPLIFISNTWVMPLHVMLGFFWFVYRFVIKQPPNTWALILVGLFGFALLQPFMVDFSAKSLSTPFALTKSFDHTPIRGFIWLFWPLLLLAAVGLSRWRQQPLLAMFTLYFVFALAFTEFIYVNDPTGGKFERTNWVMKSWGWLWVAAIMSMGTLLLNDKEKWVKALALVAMVPTLAFAPILAKAWYTSPKTDLGHLQGYNIFSRDQGRSAMLSYLQSQPPGIVLERSPRNNNTDATLYALFSDNPASYGWFNHLITWHSTRSHIMINNDKIQNLYRGKLEHAGYWLQQRRVRYVVWTIDDSLNSEMNWQAMYDSIADQYVWLPFVEQGDRRLGLFVFRGEPWPVPH